MKAVIYARFSSHGQREQSIEGQLRDCYEYARRNDIDIVGEYIDRAISGTTDDRPSFQRMIADAAKKQFDRVLVWKLDRFARNRYDSALYKHRLKQHNVRVISAMENVGDGDESILLEALLEASAEYYSLDLKKKIQRGQRENIAKGRYCGGPVPYGWKAVDGKLLLDEKTAPHKRYFLEQYAAGVPSKDILDELHARGVRSRRGGRLSYSTFVRALTDPICIGKYTYNGEVIEGLAERMISDETYEKIQSWVNARKRAPAAAKAKTEYLLHGKAYCGHCGSNMIGESGSGRGGRYYYYTCAARKKSHTCNKSNEKKDMIEQYVVRQTLMYVLAPSQQSYIAHAIVAEYEKGSDAGKIKEFEKAIRQCERELDKLVDALIDAPKAAHKRIYEKMESLESQKTALESELTKLRIACDLRITESEIIAWLNQFCSGDPSDPEFRRTIINAFVNSVYLYDDRMLIFYNIKGAKNNLQKNPLPPQPPTKESPTSDLISNAPPFHIKSEPYFFFVNGVFGCIFPRRGAD